MDGQSRYYEDWSEDDELPPVERVIEPGDVAAFIDLLHLDVPLFHDDAAAQAAGHQRRIAPGPVLLSYAMASVVPSGWLAESLIGLVRMDAVEFKRPAYVGDRVRFTNRFVAKRRCQRADRGAVTLRLRATNADGDALLGFERTFLVKRRAEAR
jgi:acyl dehydratase